MRGSYSFQPPIELSLRNPVKTILQLDAIRATRATMKKRVADATKKSLISTTESPEKLSDEVSLDDKNYGLPPENSGISEVKKGASFDRDIPQYVVDEKGNVFYNFAGGNKLAKVLGKRLPNIDELVYILNTNPERYRKFVGWCDMGNFKFYSQHDIAYFWSADELDSSNARYAYLRNDGSRVSENFGDRDRGMGVRFFLDEA